MTSKSNRFLLLLVPLIFGVREILFYTLRWETVAEPTLMTSDWCCSFKGSSSSLPSTTALTDIPSPQLLRRKSDCVEVSFESTLQSIRKGHASEIDFEQHHDERRVQLRSYPRRDALPCIPAGSDWLHFDTSQTKPMKQGIMYVKTHKTGSTTVQGVAVRMAMKAAERHNQRHNTTYTACQSRLEHWPAYLMDYRNRQRKSSFMFAVLREPTMRAISMFFHFEVSRRKKEPTDKLFQRYLTTVPDPDNTIREYYPWGWPYDHYLHFLSVDGYTIGSGEQSSQLRMNTVNQILQDYDFIGITERLDESLVALQMILGLKTSDILYYSAKGNGSWDDKGVYIQPSFVSEGMHKFFASPKWNELSKGDYLLYLAANASLDRTIDSLGREEFNQKLALFRHAKELVLTNCTAIMPLYSSEGKSWQSDCLIGDAGCGSQCFDQLERQFFS